MHKNVTSTKKVLLFFFALFALLFLRSFWIGFIEHEQHSAFVKKIQTPKKNSSSPRGSIFFRGGEPLAKDDPSSVVGLFYPEIKKLPAKIRKGPDLIPFRKNYVKEIAAFLSPYLNLHPEEIEDLFWAKSVFSGKEPFLLPTNLKKEEWFYLKGQAHLWPGLFVGTKNTRLYPQNAIAGHLAGFLGLLNREEIERKREKIEELKTLISSLEEENNTFLIDERALYEEEISLLQEEITNVSKSVGKAGLEKRWDPLLKGYGENAGQDLLLSLDFSLQRYAELLLAYQEKVRSKTALHASLSGKRIKNLTPLLMAGSALVVIDAQTGKVRACASYPRLTPQAFSEKNSIELHRQMETPFYKSLLWHQIIPLERETADLKSQTFHKEYFDITWNRFKEMATLGYTPYREAIERVEKLNEAFFYLKSFKNLLNFFPYLPPKDIFSVIDFTAPVLDIAIHPLLLDKNLTSEQKLYLADWCHLILHPYLDIFNLDGTDLSPFTLSDFKEASDGIVILKYFLKKHVEEAFYTHHFIPWRALQEKSFIKEIREQEKRAGRKNKPYDELLKAEEKRQFIAFWEDQQAEILLSFIEENPHPLLNGLKPLSSLHTHLVLKTKTLLLLLDRDQKKQLIENIDFIHKNSVPLYGYYALFKNKKSSFADFAFQFYPYQGFSFGRSYAYMNPAIPGSVFKIVTAMAALHKKQEEVLMEERAFSWPQDNPLEITDEWFIGKKGVTVGKRSDGTPIPQIYAGGRIPKSLNPHIGKTDLIKAMEQSSNPYFALLAYEYCGCEGLEKMAKSLKLSEKTGLEIPFEHRGNFPKDLEEPNAIFSTAIGQHTLLSTPLQIARVLLGVAHGKEPPPLTLLEEKISLSWEEQPPLLEKIPQGVLFEGMRRVVKKCSQKSLMDFTGELKSALALEKIRDRLIGKTSTSEAIERLPLGTGNTPFLVSHTWFGGILFKDPLPKQPLFSPETPTPEPELIIVVYLRYGDFGKDVIPIALQTAHFWDSLKGKKDQQKPKKESKNRP